MGWLRIVGCASLWELVSVAVRAWCHTFLRMMCVDQGATRVCCGLSILCCAGLLCYACAPGSSMCCDLRLPYAAIPMVAYSVTYIGRRQLVWLARSA